MALKQVILVRKDLKLPPGKMAAQVAHASVESAHRAEKQMFAQWRQHGMGKIVLKVENLKELIDFEQFAKDAGLPCALITDAGHTVIAPGTVTCLGIGPAQEEVLDKITGNLKMY